MKKIIISGLVLLILLACTSTPGKMTQEDKTTIDAIVDKWVAALRQKDIDSLMDTYWPDSVHTTIDTNGTVVETVQGSEDFRIKQQEMFNQSDSYKLIVYSDPEKDFDSEQGSPIYKILGRVGEGEWRWQDIFQFVKRNGEWRIIDHILIGLP